MEFINLVFGEQFTHLRVIALSMIQMRDIHWQVEAPGTDVGSPSIASHLNTLSHLTPMKLTRRDVRQLSTDLSILSQRSLKKYASSTPKQLLNITSGIFHTSAMLLAADHAWKQLAPNESRQVSTLIFEKSGECRQPVRNDHIEACCGRVGAAGA